MGEVVLAEASSLLFFEIVEVETGIDLFCFYLIFISSFLACNRKNILKHKIGANWRIIIFFFKFNFVHYSSVPRCFAIRNKAYIVLRIVGYKQVIVKWRVYRITKVNRRRPCFIIRVIAGFENIIPSYSVVSLGCKVLKRLLFR